MDIYVDKTVAVIEGVLLPFPASKLKLSAEQVMRFEQIDGADYYRVQNLDLVWLSERFGTHFFEDGVVSVVPYDSNKFKGLLGLSPERHLGYAFQWFCLALLWVIMHGVFFVYTRKR